MKQRAFLRPRMITAAPVLAVLAILLLELPARGQDPLLWDYAPYRIQVWLALEDAPQFTPRYREELSRALREQAELSAGPAWDLTVGPAPGGRRSDLLRHLDRVTPERLVAMAPELFSPDQGFEIDKVLVVSIVSQAHGFVVRTREFDGRSRSWGPLYAERTEQAARAASLAFDLLVKAFAPVVRIERTKTRTCEVRARARGLVSDPRSPCAVWERDVLRPVVRRNDRLGRPTPGGIMAAPWTYLVVEDQSRLDPAEERGRNNLVCRIWAGVRSPLSGRASRRVEKFALLVKPPGEATRLSLQTITPPVKKGEKPIAPRPLAGYEIYAKPIHLPDPAELAAAEAAAAAAADATAPTAVEETTETAEEKEAAQLELLGTTDWRGQIEVPKGGDSPLRLIYVKSGNTLLARLPLVPGFEPRALAELRPDDLRLEAEGVVRGLEGRLTDTVVRRAVLAARIERRLEEGDVAKALELLEEFRTLPTRRDFEERINGQRGRFRTTDPNVQKRIDGLFDAIGSNVRRFIDPNQTNELARKVREKQAAAAAS